MKMLIAGVALGLSISLVVPVLAQDVDKDLASAFLNTYSDNATFIRSVAIDKLVIWKDWRGKEQTSIYADGKLFEVNKSEFE